jgi:hypothetical protein
MPRCIYCQQDRSADAFTKVEHVMPQSFGRFQHNFTLKNLVCDDCNHYFGNHLELFLGRDSYEGQLRFRHGLKEAEEFKGVGRKTRIVVRSTEGTFAGCYMLRYYNAEKNDISVRPLPQVGFMLAPERAYRYFLLDEIPTQAELDGMGFDKVHPKPIVALEVDPPELAARLAAKGIAFNYRGPLPQNPPLDTIGCELTARMDHVIFRAMAKIAFNYLAYWEGGPFVQQQGLDRARRHIRRGEIPNYELLRVDEEPILGDEPTVGNRRLGHLTTIGWADDGVSVLSQVSLLNWMTYHICLAPELGGPPPPMTRGHFFHPSSQEILELEPRRRVAPT